MLDSNMKSQLKLYLEKLTQPVELIATLDDSEKSTEISTLLQDISTLSDKITFNKDNNLTVRKPSFLITNPGKDSGLRLAIIASWRPSSERSGRIVRSDPSIRGKVSF